MRIKDICLSIFVVFIWGSYFMVEKIAFDAFPPILFCGLRYFIVFIFSAPFLFKNKISLKETICFSFVNLFNILALNIAINLTSNLAPIILIQQLSVPISIALGVLFFKEKININHFIGMILAFSGLVVILKFHPDEKMPFTPACLSVINAILFALYNLFAKKLSRANFMQVLGVLSITSFPVLLILSFFFEKWPKSVDIPSVLVLLYVTIISGILCLYIWMQLLNKYPMNKVTPFLLLVPIFGCLSTSFTLDEKLTYDIIIGGAMITIGLAIIEAKKLNA